MMKRKIYDELVYWKNTNIQKPLMIIGARQIGKTYIIKQFCEKEFQKNIYISKRLTKRRIETSNSILYNWTRV